MTTRTVLDILPAYMAEELEATSRKMYDALRAIPADASAQLGSKDREIQTLTKHADSWYKKAKAATLRLAEANKVIGTLERQLEQLKGLKASAGTSATLVLGSAKKKKSPTETELMSKATLKKPKAGTRRKARKGRGRKK